MRGKDITKFHAISLRSDFRGFRISGEKKTDYCREFRTRSDYCHLWIIAFQFINMIDFCRK
jgi:hypothetical protein